MCPSQPTIQTKRPPRGGLSEIWIETRVVKFYSCLTKPFDDDPCTVAAFAGLVPPLTLHLGYLFAGSPAVRADVLSGAWRAGLRIIIGTVVPSWSPQLHSPRPVFALTNNLPIENRSIVFRGNWAFRQRVSATRPKKQTYPYKS